MKSTDKIAMKISEEECNDIFPVLKDNKLLVTFLSTWTPDWSYLVNVDDYKRNLISVNLLKSVRDYKILPYNKKLFLQYCGINIEETLQEYIKRVNSTLYSSFFGGKRT